MWENTHTNLRITLDTFFTFEVFHSSRKKSPYMYITWLHKREIVVVNLKALVISISFEHYVVHEFWSLISLEYDSILRFYWQKHSQYCIVYPHTYDSFFQELYSRIGILNLHALSHSFIGWSCSSNYNNQVMIDSHDCHPITLTDMKWFTWLAK